MSSLGKLRMHPSIHLRRTQDDKSNDRDREVENSGGSGTRCKPLLRALKTRLHLVASEIFVVHVLKHLPQFLI